MRLPTMDGSFLVQKMNYLIGWKIYFILSGRKKKFSGHWGSLWQMCKYANVLDQ